MHLKISNFNGELPVNYKITRQTKKNYCVVSLYFINPFSETNEPEEVFVTCWSKIIKYKSNGKSTMISLLKEVQKTLNIQLLNYKHFNNKFNK